MKRRVSSLPWWRERGKNRRTRSRLVRRIRFQRLLKQAPFLSALASRRRSPDELIHPRLGRRNNRDALLRALLPSCALSPLTPPALISHPHNRLPRRQRKQLLDVLLCALTPPGDIDVQGESGGRGGLLFEVGEGGVVEGCFEELAGGGAEEDRAGRVGGDGGRGRRGRGGRRPSDGVDDGSFQPLQRFGLADRLSSGGLLCGCRRREGRR